MLGRQIAIPFFVGNEAALENTIMKSLRLASLGILVALTLGGVACSSPIDDDAVAEARQASSQDGSSNYPSKDPSPEYKQPISMDGWWTIEGYQDRCYLRAIGWNSIASGNTIVGINMKEEPVLINVKLAVEYYRKTEDSRGRIGWSQTVPNASFEWKTVQVKYYPKQDRTEFDPWTFPKRTTRSGVSATPARIIAYQVSEEVKYTVNFQTYFKSGGNTDVIVRVAPFEKKGDVKPKDFSTPIAVDLPVSEDDKEIPACSSCGCTTPTAPTAPPTNTQAPAPSQAPAPAPTPAPAPAPVPSKKDS